MSNFHFPDFLRAAISPASPPRRLDIISAYEVANSVQERILCISHSIEHDERVWSERGICCVLARQSNLAIEVLGKTVTTYGSPVAEENGTLWYIHMGNQEAMWTWKTRGVEQEANVCAEVYRQNGIPIVRIKVVPIMRDWSGSRASSDPNYQQFTIGDGRWAECWDSGRADGYISKRVYQHIRAENGDVQLCSDDERWGLKECFKVFGKTGKRALKVTETKAGAEMFRDEYLAGDHKRTAKIQHVKAEAHRCKKAYCPAFSVCEQGKR